MNHKVAISTVSMGWHPSHTFERKVQAAQAAGFQGIELFITDLDRYAAAHSLTRIQAAEAMAGLCRAAHLEILGLASLDEFDGEPAPLEGRLNTAREWLLIAKALGTQVIQIPANDNKHAIGDEKIIVSELRQLADLGLQEEPPVSFAYEAMAWSTHVADWEESLRIVQLVDRPNFGLCLDTYHVLARLWADPSSHHGVRPGGASSLRASLQRFLESCTPEKIMYIQLSDAERCSPPILPGHPAYHPNKPATQSWCTYGRLFPYEMENGAYLPMDEILRAWMRDKGWSGWVSMEVFHREMKDESAGPEMWAERARRSWDKVVKTLET